MFDALLEELGSRTVALNSTAEAFELYRRRGFAPVGEIHQHQGVLLPPEQGAGRMRLRAADAAEFDLLARLDQDAVGRPRPGLLHKLMAEGCFAVLERNRAVRGFAVAAASDADTLSALSSQNAPRTRRRSSRRLRPSWPEASSEWTRRRTLA